MPDITQPDEGFQYPEDLSALSADELAQVEADALAAFEELAGTGDDLLSEAQVDEMERLADFVQTVRDEGAGREAAAVARRERAEAAAQRIAPAEDSESGSEEVEESGEAAEEVPAEEAAPEAQQVAA